MKDFLEFFLKALKPLGLRLLVALRLLFDHHPARITLALVLMMLAVLSGTVYVDRVTRYEEIVSTTVRAEMEDTPQRFKVLEAFILSAVDRNISSDIADATISSSFQEQMDRIDKELAASSEIPDDLNLSISVPDGVGDDWTLRSQNGVLTDKQDPGFLFFPLELLRARFDAATYAVILGESKAKKHSPNLESAVRKDDVIADDVITSRRISPILANFTGLDLLKANSNLSDLAIESRPTQVYYITKNGLNRIINNSGGNQQVVYRNLFRARTFFPSRPYFIEAFNRGEPGQLKKLSGRIGDQFYVSQPYLDIGGFGVVVTLARAIRYTGHSDAALCFDLRVKMDNPLTFRLRQKLQSFGARPEPVSCDIGFSGKIDCSAEDQPETGELYRLAKKLSDNINSNMHSGDLSTIVGNINILANPPEARSSASAGFADFFLYPIKVIFAIGTTPISFAVPLSSPVASDSHTIKAEFLICTLDFGRFLQLTSAYGLISVSLAVSAFFVVILWWQSESQTRKSWQDAFSAVDSVLYGATTAYCRLDAQDRIVDCNTAFCSLLGLLADRATVERLKGQTFESMVAPRSKMTYQDVQRRRQNNQNVPPYTLFFLRSDGAEVETRVTSGEIPVRSKGSLPETFGIFIPAASAQNPLNSAASAG